LASPAIARQYVKHLRNRILDHRLMMLATAPPEAVAALLSPALDAAEPEERSRIAAMLLRTGRADALTAVIRNLHLLDATFFGEQLFATNAPFAIAAKFVVSSRDRRSILNLIDLADYRHDCSLLPAMTRLLRSPDARISSCAAGVLLSTVAAHHGEHGRRHARRGVAAAIDGALAIAAEHWREHRQDEALLAAAILGHRAGPKLRAMLDDDDHPAGAAMRGVVARIDLPLVRRNFIRWLADAEPGRQVIRWMHHLETAEEFTDLLSGGHLLAARGRRGMLQRTDRPTRCLPQIDTAINMPGDAQRFLPALADGLGMTDATRVQRLAEMIALPSPAARRRVVIALSRHRSDVARCAVLRFADDSDPAVAWSAAVTVLARPDQSPTEVLDHLVENGHEPIAFQARLHRSGRSVDRFFAVWLELPLVERMAAARRLNAVEPDRFCTALADQFVFDHRERALAAIVVARRLALIPGLEDRLIVLAGGEDVHVASAAIGALRSGRTAERVVVLRRALQHANARARANAIESLAEGATDPVVAEVTPIAESRSNRPRANAIRMLMRHQPKTAHDRLRAMLRDHQPMHRLSAVWVAQHARNRAIADELKHLGAHEEFPIVRARAASAARVVEFNTGRAASPALGVTNQ